MNELRLYTDVKKYIKVVIDYLENGPEIFKLQYDCDSPDQLFRNEDKARQPEIVQYIISPDNNRIRRDPDYKNCTPEDWDRLRVAQLENLRDVQRTLDEIERGVIIPKDRFPQHYFEETLSEQQKKIYIFAIIKELTDVAVDHESGIEIQKRELELV